MTFKPRVSKCGNHWNVEYYQGGELSPLTACRATWEECLNLGLSWFKKYPPLV